MTNFFKYFVPWLWKHATAKLLSVFLKLVHLPVALHKWYADELEGSLVVGILLSLGSAILSNLFLMLIFSISGIPINSGAISLILVNISFWVLHFIVTGISVAYRIYKKERDATLDELTKKY